MSPSLTCSIGWPSIDPDVSTTNVTIAGFLTSPHESMMCVNTSGCSAPGWIVGPRFTGVQTPRREPLRIERDTGARCRPEPCRHEVLLLGLGAQEVDPLASSSGLVRRHPRRVDDRRRVRVEDRALLRVDHHEPVDGGHRLGRAVPAERLLLARGEAHEVVLGHQEEVPEPRALDDLRVHRDRAGLVVVDELLEVLHVLADLGALDVGDRQLAGRLAGGDRVERHEDVAAARRRARVGEREQGLATPLGARAAGTRPTPRDRRPTPGCPRSRGRRPASRGTRPWRGT